MGQVIHVTGSTAGDAAIFEADRSLSGQDGGAYESREETDGDPTFPARLAARAFDSDSAITRVFAGSNGIVVHRQGGWSEAEMARMGSLIEEFFVYYPA